MMNFLKMLEDEISAWPNMSVHPHRFGGKEFLFGNAEVGHIHTGGIVDIPFPRSVRDALLAEGLAEGTGGFPTLDGRRSAFAAKKTSSMPCGLCGSHTLATRSRPQPILVNC